MNEPANDSTVISHAHPIAYFCAEFGFDQNLPVYAGGLGILAGDTIKQAADDSVPFIGVTLLYRGYGMRQRITDEGDQIDEDWLFDPLSTGLEHVYVDGMPLFIKVHLTEVDVWLRCWKKTFANGVVLYFLDSETDQNQLPERSITQVLYSGTHESQIKQQLILGIGGVKLLTALGIQPALYHLNEGRPAFLHWQLIRQLMDIHSIDYHSARQLAIQKTVYTNHTLVSAGNMGYSMDLLRVFAGYYAAKMRISVEELLSPAIDTDPNIFSTTTFALNVSRKASGVSKLHSRLSEEYWPRYHWTNITNAVHFPTWQSAELVAAQDDPRSLWEAHSREKQLLSDFCARHTGYGFDPHRLVITWARRIAGYKQLNVVFSDIDRLAALVRSQSRPVQILIAGKAHQGDAEGKAVLKQVISYMKDQLSGHALFVPNYSIDVASHLVRGSDVWLNTPQLGKEASGTSGMKAIANGVLQCTVADGWAAEVDWKDMGWVLSPDNLAESLYTTLEHEIIPQFYTRGEDGVPHAWVARMQKTLALAPQFSSKRMLQEYIDLLYS